MQYFIKRGENFFGPYNLHQIRELANTQKLSSTDRISDNQQGPFQPIQNFLQQIQAGAAPSTEPVAAPSAYPQNQMPATPTAPSNQGIANQGVGTAFLYQTNYAKPKKPATTGNDTKKTLLIIGGSIGGLVSLILLVFLFRTIFMMVNEIKEQKQAERAAAIARENSPEAKAKRKALAQGVTDFLTGQSSQSSSSTGNTSPRTGASQSRQPTLPEREIINAIGAKLGRDQIALQAYESERKNGELKGNLKLKDVPNALAQLEVYAVKDKLSYRDAIDIARLSKEIDFARKRGK